MSIEGLPVIAVTDYPCFKMMIPELPDTYGGWLELLARVRIRQPGALAVPVTPLQFSMYCRRYGGIAGNELDLALLVRCVTRMAYVMMMLPPAEASPEKRYAVG